MKVLVTGGAGYIGSTVCSALLDHGHTPIILDSLVTGRKEFTKNKIFYEGDISDMSILKKIFADHPDIEYTIHFAALISVPESVAKPYNYYHENVTKSLELFNNLNSLGCKNVVYSSSASVYDDVPEFLVSESSPINPRSPYARTKFMIEMLLQDLCIAYEMKGIALRYFNPIGADPQLRSGAYIQFPSNVLGTLLDAASKKDAVFKITGTNWPTRDGSGLRDYIHVWDLALAHVKAIENFNRVINLSDYPNIPYQVINLGTGKGVTVKELITAFESVLGRPINKEEVKSRPGDIAGSYANTDKAKKLLGWEVVHSIEDSIRDALRWDKVKNNIIKY